MDRDGGGGCKDGWGVQDGRMRGRWAGWMDERGGQDGRIRGGEGAEPNEEQGLPNKYLWQYKYIIYCRVPNSEYIKNSFLNTTTFYTKLFFFQNCQNLGQSKEEKR